MRNKITIRCYIGLFLMALLMPPVAYAAPVLVVTPLYGRPDTMQAGDIVRIELFNQSFPFWVKGKVRIQSASTGYDSGDQPLTFERGGSSLYYLWDTAGLAAASDYAISVTLSVSGRGNAGGQQVIVSLNNRLFEPSLLAAEVDAAAPASGIPLKFSRVAPQDWARSPYLGPLGRGWVHNFDLKLEEFTDGRIAFHGPDGFNRFFESNWNGTYTTAPGDHGILTRDPDGTFQLREKDGVIYRFHSDLRLNYIQDLNGNRINANYDGSNRLIKIVHSSGQSFSFEYNDAGRIVHLIDSVGRVTTYEYDADHGLLLRVIDPSGAATEYLYSLGQGDALNFRLLSVTYPDGTHTHYEYNAQGHLVRRAGTSGLNPVAYGYSPDGLTSIVDATGGEMKVRVNDRGQPVAAIDPHGGLTQYEYDAAANLAKTIDPLGRATQFFYDEFGNLTQATNPLGEAIKLGYDLRFNKPAWVLDPLGNGTAFAYDPQGNLQKTVFPDSTQQNYAYDPQGNLVAFQDGAGITTEFAYNAQGRMMARRDALGNLTQFAYDAAGDPQTVTDAMGRVVSNSRDVLGRLLRRTYPDGSHEDYEYDAASKITAFINRRGERITFAYDVAGHLEWKTYPSGRAWHYLYDAAGYLVRVEEVVGGNAALVVAYEYDASHRVTKARVPGKSPQETYDVSYAYDPAGNRTQMIYPDGVVLNYGYDAANRLIWIADAGDNPIVTYGYDAAGRRINRVLGNRTITGYLYDTLNRLIEVGNYSPEMAPQSRFAYTYNPAGMRTSMTTLEGTHNYDYDPTYQLTDVSYPDGRKVGYAFDPVGNRTGVNDNGNVTGYATNALDQYTQAGSETFGYDGNGNLTARAGGNVTSYAWDEDDHLIGVNRNGVAIGYHYDHQGRLAAKAINGQETRYVWDGIHIIAEMDSAGNIVKRYIYGPTIDEILIVTANGTNYWAQQDGLGSVVGATDNSGALIVAISYDVYGNIRSGDLGPVPQRFAGMWWDGDAGLYYVRATWYEPTLGRFLSIDPIRAIQEKVLYSYAENNPINLGFG